MLFRSQPTGDINKYLPLDEDGDEPSTIDLMEATLSWRVIAPTAPDTLWCYPYQNKDPFVLGKERCPALYAVGNAKAFETRLIAGDAEGERTRLVAVPEFNKTGEIVVVDVEDLSVQVIKVGVEEVG